MFIPSVTRFALRLGGSAASLALACLLPSASAQDDSATARESNTRVPLPSGRTMTLSGEWTIEPTLWGEHALLLGHGRLDVVEPGASAAREIVATDRMQTLSGWPVFGNDGRTVYKWLDQRRQLAAIDVTSGTVRTLTQLKREGSFFSEKHLEAAPEYLGPAAVEDVDANRVWFILNRGGDNEGGWLSGVDRTAGEAPLATDLRITMGRVSSWVHSARRATTFILANEEGWSRLYSVRLGATAAERIEIPPHGFDRVVLSPEEDRLLLERAFCVDCEAEPTRYGGFEILHLETGECVEGPSRGHQAAFFPDGNRVVYQFRWELKQFDIATAEEAVLATVSPGAKPLPASPSYYSFPVWSTDGRTFVVNVGEEDCSQVIDVVGRRIFLGPGDYGWDFAWAPAGLKFK